MIRISAVLTSAALFAALLGPSADARTYRSAARVGAIAGPIIGGFAANNGYYAYGPYYGPAPLLGFSPLYGPAYPYAPGCYLQRQRIWTDYGWRWRAGPICY